MTQPLTVVGAAWAAAGRPGTPTDLAKGRCARCSSIGLRTKTTGVVSRKFTAVDGWDDRTQEGLCQGCAWAYTSRQLRTHCHLVGHGPVSLAPLTRTQTLDLLVRGALTSRQCLVVPLHPGRKHILPHAQWAQVAIDDVSLPWGQRQSELLGTAAQLRDLGVSARALLEPIPPFAVVRSDPKRAQLVWKLWEELGPWRTPGNPYGSLVGFLLVSSTQQVRRGA